MWSGQEEAGELGGFLTCALEGWLPLLLQGTFNPLTRPAALLTSTSTLIFCPRYKYSYFKINIKSTATILYQKDFTFNEIILHLTKRASGPLLLDIICLTVQANFKPQQSCDEWLSCQWLLPEALTHGVLIFFFL